MCEFSFGVFEVFGKWAKIANSSSFSEKMKQINTFIMFYVGVIVACVQYVLFRLRCEKHDFREVYEMRHVSSGD